MILHARHLVPIVLFVFALSYFLLYTSIPDPSNAAVHDTGLVTIKNELHPQPTIRMKKVTVQPTYVKIERKEWTWRRNDTLFHNLGQTLSSKMCRRGFKSQFCSQLSPVDSKPYKPMLCGGSGVLMFWPSASSLSDTKSCGPYGLHMLPYTLNRKLGCAHALMFSTSKLWDKPSIFPEKVPRIPPHFPNIKQYDGIIVIPDVFTPKRVPWLEETRVVRWMLGWHHGIHRNARILSHNHHVQRIGPSVTSTLLQHPPPPMYLDHVRKHGVDLTKKENLVIVDGDSGISVSKLSKDLSPDIKVVELKGLATDEVIKLYKRAKITMDAKMPGLEAMNIEGKYFECVCMLGNHMVGFGDHDFSAVSLDLRFDVNKWDEMLNKIRSAVSRYEIHRNEQQLWRRDLMDNMHWRWERDLGTVFLAQSVLFRTRAVTYSEQRAVIPWILSVASAYPLARFDVLVPDKAEFEREFEGPLLLLKSFESAIISPAFGTIRSSKSCDLMEERPEYVGHMYTVYSSPHALFLGRDFLNSHARFLDERGVDAVGDFNTVVVARGSGSPHRECSLPLDILMVKDDDPSPIKLYLTQDWVIDDIDDADVQEALDPLINGPVWPVLSSHFGSAYHFNIP